MGDARVNLSFSRFHTSVSSGVVSGTGLGAAPAYLSAMSLAAAGANMLVPTSHKVTHTLLIEPEANPLGGWLFIRFSPGVASGRRFLLIH